MLPVSFIHKNMTELTKEYFEEKLSTLATKEYFEQKLDEQTEALARMVNKAFEKHEETYLAEKFERLTDTQNLQVEVRSLTQRVEQLEKRRS